MWQSVLYIDFKCLLLQYGLRQKMNRSGNYRGNAVNGSFLNMLKKLFITVIIKQDISR